MDAPQFSAEQQQNAAPVGAHTKKRQYAAGQTQAYQGTAETVPQYSDPAAMMQPGAAPGGQLFTPGFTGESSGFQQQQQQATPYFAPQDGHYPAGQQHAAMPPYQQGAAPMAQLGDQFGQMNLQGGQKPVSMVPKPLILNRKCSKSFLVCSHDHQFDWNSGRSSRT